MMFQDRYSLVKKVGSAPSGEIFLARDGKLGRHVLIKTLRVDTGGNKQETEQRQKKFLRDIKSAGKLIHKNIITLFDVGKINEDLFIAIEFVEGQPLDFFLRDQTALPISRVIMIVLQIADALEYAAEQSVYHRNLSPHIITILPDYQVKIQDFGMSPPSPVDSLSSSSSGNLNPSYEAPEVILGRSVDHRADIFSLGCIMYQMLTGSRPFSGRSASSVYHKILNSDPDEWMQRLSYFPGQLQTIISKMLEKEPDKRYATYRELINDLTECEESVRIMEEKTTIAPSPMATNGHSRGNDSKAGPTPRKKLKTPLPISEGTQKPRSAMTLEKGDQPSGHNVPALKPIHAEQMRRTVRDMPDSAPDNSLGTKSRLTSMKSELLVLLGFFLVFSIFVITVVWLFWGDISFVLKYFGPTSSMVGVEPWKSDNGDYQLPSEHPETLTSAFGPEQGLLSLTSEPTGARVFVDGQYLGNTPLNSMRLATGNPKLQIERDGYAIWEQRVTIESGSPKTITATLVRVSTISIATVPPGASIAINGIPRGFTPTELHDLPEGTHELLLGLEGYHTHQETIVIGPDDLQRSISIPLRKTATGSLRIVTEPGVTVRLNGDKQTSGPGTVDSIPIGSHTITFSIAGKPAKILPVIIIEGRTTEVEHFFFKPGSLRINAIPFGTAYLDGKELGVTPIFVEVPVGTYDLKIIKDGYHTVNTRVTIREDREEQLFLTLEKK